MKKLLLALTIGLLLALTGLVHAEEPIDCAPEDRTIPGNTNSPCNTLLHLDKIETVEYVVMEAEGRDVCYEALTLRPYNFERDFPEEGFEFTSAATATPGFGDSWYSGRVTRNGSSGFQATGTEEYLMVSLGSRSHHYVDSPVSLDGVFVPGYFFHLSTTHWTARSPWLPVPAEAQRFNQLMNNCLHTVKLRLDAEAEAIRLASEEAQAELAREQALSDELAQAELDQQRLESAQEQLRLAQERELIETRSLQARLERDRIIVGIIQEITEEQMRGNLERSAITNAYLQEIETNYESFSVEIQESYDELQRLEILNQIIMDTITAYGDAINAQIEEAERLESESLEKIDAIIATEDEEPIDSPDTPPDSP